MIPDEHLTLRQLARRLGIARSEVRELSARKIITPVEPGLYALLQCTTAYIRYLRARAAGSPATPVAQLANINLKTARADLLDLRLRREAGEFVAVDDVRRAWFPIVRGIRQFVLSVPGLVAFEIQTLTATDRQAIEKICRQSLEDAALGVGFQLAKTGNSATPVLVEDQDQDDD